MRLWRVAEPVTRQAGSAHLAGGCARGRAYDRVKRKGRRDCATPFPCYQRRIRTRP